MSNFVYNSPPVNPFSVADTIIAGKWHTTSLVPLARQSYRLYAFIRSREKYTMNVLKVPPKCNLRIYLFFKINWAKCFLQIVVIKSVRIVCIFLVAYLNKIIFPIFIYLCINILLVPEKLKFSFRIVFTASDKILTSKISFKIW